MIANHNTFNLEMVEDANTYKIYFSLFYKTNLFFIYCNNVFVHLQKRVQYLVQHFQQVDFLLTSRLNVRNTNQVSVTLSAFTSKVVCKSIQNIFIREMR